MSAGFKHIQSKIIKFVFFAIFLLLHTQFNFAQSDNSLKKDTAAAIQPRNSEKIKIFENDDYYLYDTEPAVAPVSFWQRILFWILKMIAFLFYFLNKGGNAVSFIFYGIMSALLIFVILKLIGVSPHHLFLKTKKIKIPNIPVYDEDINALDFNKIVSQAVKNEDYRKAVRFLYIKFLKILSDNELIEWKREKTNKDYKKEMQKTRYAKKFSQLTQIYEYVWYGEFRIKKAFFLSVNNNFTNVFADFE